MKSIDFSCVNVIALNTTCWPSRDLNASLVREPIMVAVAAVDLQTLTVSEQRSYLVKPRYSPISDHCTRLTGVTPQMVEHGLTYEEVCQELVMRFRSRNRTWASYGTFPWLAFGEMSKRVRNDVPLSPRHFNLKHLTAITFRLSEEVSLDRALELVNAPYYGHHNHAEEAVVMLADLLRFFVGRLQLTRVSFDNLTRSGHIGTTEGVAA